MLSSQQKNATVDRGVFVGGKHLVEFAHTHSTMNGFTCSCLLNMYTHTCTHRAHTHRIEFGDSAEMYPMYTSQQVLRN